MSEIKLNRIQALSGGQGKTIKCGLFVNKDHKIEQLSSKNAELKRMIEEQLNKNKELSLSMQQKRSKILSIQNQSNILQLEEIKLCQQVNQFQNQIQKIQPLLDQKNKNVQSLAAEVSQISEDYQSLVQKDQEIKALLQRYKQQIKKEKLICKSDSNTKRTYQEMFKKLVSYQKNTEILQNKLQSKHKYLGIITKKIEKEENLKEKEKQLSSSSYSRMMPHTKSYISSSNTNITKKDIFRQQQSKLKKNNENMKDFNNLIRKKNQILSKKS